MDDNWTFRTGVAFDDSPVPADKRSISIPDQDRFWVSAGATYAFNENASIDAGVSYMHGQKVTFQEGLFWDISRFMIACTHGKVRMFFTIPMLTVKGAKELTIFIPNGMSIKVRWLPKLIGTGCF